MIEPEARGPRSRQTEAPSRLRLPARSLRCLTFLPDTVCTSWELDANLLALGYQERWRWRVRDRETQRQRDRERWRERGARQEARRDIGALARTSKTQLSG